MKTQHGATTIHVQGRKLLKVSDRIFRLAWNEAAALAWQTGYPNLFLPVLAAEKIQAVSEWNGRQKRLRQRNSVHRLSI